MHGKWHDDVIKWKHFPCYWPFARGIHRSPVNSSHKVQWRGALMFSLICVWINGWVNNREAGDLRRHHGDYDVTVMALSCQTTTTKHVRLCMANELHHPSINRALLAPPQPWVAGVGASADYTTYDAPTSVAKIKRRNIAKRIYNNVMTLVHVMDWGCQAPSHYLTQCFPDSMLLIALWIPPHMMTCFGLSQHTGGMSKWHHHRGIYCTVGICRFIL